MKKEVKQLIYGLSMMAVAVIGIVSLGLIPGLLAAGAAHKATKTGDI